MESRKTRATLSVLLALAWPMILARSAQAVIGFCDALMTAPLGEDALAAVTTGSMNIFTATIMPMGLVFIIQSFAAQLLGKGELGAARRYAYYGLLLSAAAALIALIALPFVGDIVGLFNYEPAVAGHMTGYIEIRLFAVGAIVGIEALGNWFGGLGNTKLHMKAGLITMVTNVGLNWLLIGGNLGAPALGVEGAAIASTAASFVGFAYLAFVFADSRWGPRVGRLRLAEIGRVIRFGLPNGLSWFLEFAAFMIYINVVVAHLGTTVLAAMMVVFNVNSVSFMPAFGISSSGAILAGQAIGAGDKDQVGPIVWLTMRVAAVWQCSVGLVYLLVPTLIMSAFAPGDAVTDEMVTIGATLLALSAGWQLFDSIAMALSETLRAAGDTAWCLWARIVLAWVLFTPVSVVTVIVMGGGHVIAILSIIMYVSVLAAVFAWRFRRGAWRDIDLTGAGEVPA